AEASLRGDLLARGKDMTKLAAGDITEEMVERAMNRALGATLSLRPQSGISASLLNFYDENPWIDLLGFPLFPRYLYNAMRTFSHHSPLGLYRLGMRLADDQILNAIQGKGKLS
ncbi:MAG: hypothetical protein GTN93_13190, partial [Anaerolineae bacterium]|nr:hypothetical protein [Anaerolineae bacterium]